MPQQVQQVDPRVAAAQIRAATDTDANRISLLQSLLPVGRAPTPEELQAAQAFVASSVQSAAGGGVPRSTAPTLQQFMQAAKARNPDASDKQLQDYYQQTYGN